MTNRTFYRPNEALQKEPLHYTDCGLDNIYLQNGFMIEEFDGDKTLSISDIDGLHRAIGLHIVLSKKAPSAKELRFIREELEMTQLELSTILGISDQTVARWEKGQCEANGAAVLSMRLIYILSVTPEDKRQAILDNILDRIKVLSDTDETSDNVTMTYCKDKWTAPSLMAA